MQSLYEAASLWRLPRLYVKCLRCSHYCHALTDDVDFVNGHFCSHMQYIPRKGFRISRCQFFHKRSPNVVLYVGEVSPLVRSVY